MTGAPGDLDRTYLILSLALLVALGVQTANHQWGTDFWHHGAAVRELAERPWDPGHPVFAIDTPHPFLTPYALGAGLLVRWTGLSPVTVLAGLAMLNLVVLLAAFRLFVGELTGARLAPSLALTSGLLLWGPSPWRYGGFLHLNALGFVLPLPSTLCLGLVLLAAVLFRRWSRGGPYRLLAATLVIGGFVTVSHPISQVALAVLAAACAIHDPQPEPVGGVPRPAGTRLGGWLAVTGAGALAALVWPYYPFLQIALREASAYHMANIGMYEGAWIRIAPGLLALPLVPGRLRRRRRDPLVLATAGFALLYALGWVAGAYTLGRLVSWLALLLHVILGAEVAHRLRPGALAWWGRPAGRLLAAGLAAAAIVGLVAVSPGLVRTIPRPWLPEGLRDDPRLASPVQQYGFVTRHVSDDDVVLADPITGWPIPTFAGKIVAARNTQVLVPDHPQRLRDAWDLVRGPLPPDRLREILRRWDVDFVLLNREQWSRRIELRALAAEPGTAVHGGGVLVLLELPETESKRGF